MADIPDRNLKLMLIQSAWIAKLLPPFDKEAFYRDVVGSPYDPRADYNDRIDRRVLDAILATPLPKETLRKLTYVVWDAGNEIYNLIWTNWGGETDDFYVRDLAGIEACEAVKQLLFIGGASFDDCSPLGKLNALEHLMIEGKQPANMQPLLNLPKLTKLDLSFSAEGGNRAVVDQLKSRGVEVSEW